MTFRKKMDEREWMWMGIEGENKYILCKFIRESKRGVNFIFR